MEFPWFSSKIPQALQHALCALELIKNRVDSTEFSPTQALRFFWLFWMGWCQQFSWGFMIFYWVLYGFYMGFIWVLYGFYMGYMSCYWVHVHVFFLGLRG